jgi:hypothetical protein
VDEISRVNTQGETLEEARENLRDALRMVLKANRELSEKEQEASRREDLVVDCDAPSWKNTCVLTAASFIVKVGSTLCSLRDTGPLSLRFEI